MSCQTFITREKLEKWLEDHGAHAWSWDVDPDGTFRGVVILGRLDVDLSALEAK